MGVTGKQLYHGRPANRSGWGGGGGGVAPGGLQEWLPADSFLPLSTPAYLGGPAVFAPPILVPWESISSGYTQGGRTLAFTDPNAAGGPWGIGAGRTWFTPNNYDNTVLPWFQAVYAVNQAGAIGNRTIDLQCYYFPYEDQYVMGNTALIWGPLTRNVLSPPAPTPTARIYFTPEIQLSPSDPEGYLDRNMAWFIGVHRIPTADDYTGDCYFLGMRIRYGAL